MTDDDGKAFSVAQRFRHVRKQDVQTRHTFEGLCLVDCFHEHLHGGALQSHTADARTDLGNSPRTATRQLLAATVHCFVFFLSPACYVQGDFECKECGCRRWTSRAPSAAPAPTRIRSIIKKDEHVDYTLHEGETAQGVKYYEARHTHGRDLQRNRWRRTVRCSRAEGGPGVGFRFGLDLGFN